MKHGDMVAGSVGSADGNGLAVDLREWFYRLMTERKQIVGGETSKSNDGFGLDDLKLIEEKGCVSIDFLSLGVTVLGKLVFDDIGEIDVLALEIDGIKKLIKDLT